MRYWYDLEFLENGVTIDLVSVGVVAEDGREYYAVSTDVDLAAASPWVRDNVVNQLPPPADAAWRSRERIRTELEEFLGTDPVLWAWYGAYDHVCIAQLWGAMPDLPRALPRFTLDVRQLWEHLGRPPLPPQPDGEHHALADARHVRVRWEVLAERAHQLGLRV
ncbi:MAG TPA: polyadenylate-specific 3'-exoribonuclease AS [Mycobacteriales bacterium]|nr:polyadenylate-specific 3'-exoribonuclease AS [Mycobacteriales bacterium]